MNVSKSLRVYTYVQPETSDKRHFTKKWIVTTHRIKILSWLLIKFHTIHKPLKKAMLFSISSQISIPKGLRTVRETVNNSGKRWAGIQTKIQSRNDWRTTKDTISGQTSRVVANYLKVYPVSMEIRRWRVLIN